MDVDLRIPVTAEQKQLIYDAASADQADVAAWIRPILLKAAEDRLKRDRRAKSRE